MVKFTKQFEGQLVPEWKDAFVDYSQLKKDLKKIHLITNGVEKTQTETSFIKTIKSSLGKLSLFGNKERERSRAIKVLKLTFILSIFICSFVLMIYIHFDTGAYKACLFWK